MTPLSDDEIHERIIRTIADTYMRVDLARAQMYAEIDKLGSSLAAFNVAVGALVQSAVDAMTVGQREMYDGLLTCGTLPLDALAELEELGVL